MTKIILRNMKLIVAVDIENGIGKNGTIPWRLKTDLVAFKKITSTVSDDSKRNVVIMGRKCWESIPEKLRPLKDRLNIVISRTMPESRDENLIVVNDFDKIMEELSTSPLSEKIETIWNIGGAEIYRLALEKGLVNSICLTRVFSKHDADVFLNLDLSDFEEDESMKSAILEEGGVQFSFHTFNKKTVQSVI